MKMKQAGVKVKKVLNNIIFEILPYIVVTLYYCVWICRDRESDLQIIAFTTMTAGGVVHITEFVITTILYFINQIQKEGWKCLQYTDEEWAALNDNDDLSNESLLETPGYIKRHILIVIVGILVGFI